MRKTPHRCPVCEGKGFVPNGFYITTNGHWTTNSLEPEKCRSCVNGVIFIEDDNNISAHHIKELSYAIGYTLDCIKIINSQHRKKLQVGVFSDDRIDNTTQKAQRILEKLIVELDKQNPDSPKN